MPAVLMAKSLYVLRVRNVAMDEETFDAALTGQGQRFFAATPVYIG